MAFAPKSPVAGPRPIKIAIIAIGGQGGGVLAEWIVELAVNHGHIAQYTSVPGVAQRTGATVYYLELFPRAEADAAGRDPVMGLMPAVGDVDIVIAAELMEAGRAMVRGLVSPSRTTLIASTHRIYGITEKSAMADGRGDPAYVLEAAARNARRFIGFDMGKMAEDNGSVISSVLFGALAAAKVLPFDRADFEETIRRGGLGVQASLKAFAASYAEVESPQAPVVPEPAPPLGALSEDGRRLLEHVDRVFPAPARAVLVEGAKRLADYQDRAYAATYLERLAPIAALDRNPGARLTTETGRYLALWMSYEDVVRVADLKTRSGRFSRVRQEVKAEQDQVVRISEFMHPRLEELCDTLPAPVGAWLLETGWMRSLLAPLFRKGRRIPTSRLGGFLLLFALASLRPTRRWSLRYRQETRAMISWLHRIEALAPIRYDLACEVAECQRLVKGYGDTHARGTASFNAIMAELDAVGAGGSAERVRALRDAALDDESGVRFRALLDDPGARPAA